MTDKERLEQLEILMAELLQKQDRNSEEIGDILVKMIRLENKQDSITSNVLQIVKLVVNESDYIESLLKENISIKETLKEVLS